MKLTLQGETPSKKNSRIFNTKTKRSFPNKRYMEWHNAVVSQLQLLLLQKQIRTFSDCRIKMTVTFYHGDMKRRDSDNQLSSILDTLVDAGIIEDDNWKVIPVKLILDDYDKGNPRVELEIEEIPSFSSKLINQLKSFFRIFNERETEENA